MNVGQKKASPPFLHTKFYLLRCNFKQVSLQKKKPPSREFVQNYSFKIISVNEGVVELNTKIKQYFKPEGFFRNQVEYLVRLYFDGTVRHDFVESEDFKESLTKWIVPVFNETNFITAFISDRMYDSPLITNSFPIQE